MTDKEIVFRSFNDDADEQYQDLLLDTSELTAGFRANSLSGRQITFGVPDFTMGVRLKLLQNCRR